MVFRLSALYQIYSPPQLVQSKIIVTVVVQSLNCVQLFVTPWTTAHQAYLCFTVSQSLLKFMFIESLILSKHLSLTHSSFAFNLSQHQSLFQWISSLHQVAKVLEVQHQFFQWIFRVDLQLTGLISLLFKGLSRVFSSITIRKHHFFGAWPSIGPILTSVYDYWKDHSFDYTDLCQQSGVTLPWTVSPQQAAYYLWVKQDKYPLHILVSLVIHNRSTHHME